ncbi:MAG: hypothetical protein ACW99Q_03305 [Candidatus Kariarchaeaceae archaeon]
MHQTTYQIEHKIFYSLEIANEYLFNQLKNRLRFPTSKFDVVKINLVLIDDSTIYTTIPLRYRDDLYAFLCDLHFSRGVNIISYYGFLSMRDMMYRGMVTGISPFSFMVIRDIEQRLQV